MIKKIDLSDIEKCTEVIKKSFSTVVNQFGITQENAPTHTSFIKAEKLYSQFEQENRFMFAYFLGDEIVGYFSVVLNSENSSCELENLAVLPFYRHNGYGHEMVDFAISFAKKECKKISVSIIEENSILKTWYESIGFVHIYAKKYTSLPFTSGYMELQL